MSVFSRSLLYKHPGIRELWGAQVLSQGSFRAFQISVIWWINTNPNQVLGTGVLLALFLIASALPSIILAKPIGRFIDRTNSVSSLLLATSIGSLILMLGAAISLASFFSHFVAIALGASLALVHALFDPSLQKHLGAIAEGDDLDSGVKLVTSTQSIVNFAGAVVGAFLINSFSITSIFTFGSLLYIAAFTFLFAKKNQNQIKTNPSLPDLMNATSTFQWDLILFKMVIGFGFINFFLTPIVIILPLYVQKIFIGTAVDLGILEASISIGLILGMLVGQKITQAYSVLSTAAVAMAITGTALLVPGFIAYRAVYLVVLFIAGFSVGCNNVKVITYFQTVIPQHNKGQFFSYLQATISFAVPIGYLIFGYLGDVFSPRILCLVEGTGILALSFYFLWIEKQHVVAT